MPKFFIKETNCNISDIITVSGDDAKHISKTLRMRIGDALNVTDTNGTDYSCIITKITADAINAEVKDKKLSDSESCVKVTLFQALAKGDKMDTVIQKSVELGVYEIYPVATVRSVMKLDKSSAEKKTERWNKIALEAAKQCGRGIVPRVHTVIDFKTCVSLMSNADNKFFCYEDCHDKTAKDIIATKNYRTLSFFVGPEGGVAPEEAQYAKEHGITDVSLGKLILRTETAAPAVLAMVLYEKEL